VAERSNAAVSKTVSGLWVRRGFKSLPLRLAFHGSFRVIAFAALVAPAPASAHVRTGAVAVDYRATASSPDPALEVRILQSDRALQLSVQPGHTVAVLVGPGSDPFLTRPGHH
jgi:hypothetical protein